MYVEWPEKITEYDLWKYGLPIEILEFIGDAKNGKWCLENVRFGTARHCSIFSCAVPTFPSTENELWSHYMYVGEQAVNEGFSDN